MKIEILDEAEEDLVDGYRFYERVEVGLGEYFLDTAFSVIDSLRLYAGIHEVHVGHHRILMSRFPFAVYYGYSQDVVKVVAILDCRRDPGFIVRRLR